MASKIRFGCLVLLAAAGYATTEDLIQAERVESARAVLVSPSRVGRDALLAKWEDQADQDIVSRQATPPAALALAALWVEQAAAAPPLDRTRSLARAEALLAAVRAIRPESPDASLLEVRADWVRHGSLRARTLATFARSYDQARFLREEGPWRVAVAAVYWSRLPARTRAAAVNEAVWLARVDGRLRTTIDQLVTGTPLALPVELRLMI